MHGLPGLGTPRSSTSHSEMPASQVLRAQYWLSEQRVAARTGTWDAGSTGVPTLWWWDISSNPAAIQKRRLAAGEGLCPPPVGGSIYKAPEKEMGSCKHQAGLQAEVKPKFKLFVFKEFQFRKMKNPETDGGNYCHH